jgi:hypothetical protein
MQAFQNFQRFQRLALRYAPKAHLVFALFWLVTIIGITFGLWRPWAWLVGNFFISGGALILIWVWATWQRERLLRESPLPQFLKRKLRMAYPNLSGKDCDLVERGLRQFFLACSRSKGKFVAMPSKVVDHMWHDFILHTKAYDAWCDLVLGRFLHHTPAEALGPKAKNNDGLRRAWFWACKDEAINPRAPTRLPLLFALDTKLKIAGGFMYVPDCKSIQAKSDAGGDGSGSYCGTSFSDGSSSSASTSDGDSFGGSESSSSSDGGDGGGDGGGCGGGD